MILETVLNAVAGIINSGINLLPHSSWNPDASGADTVVGYMKGLNSVLPIDVGLGLFGIAVFFTQATLGWRIVLWIYQHLPFIGKG